MLGRRLKPPSELDKLSFRSKLQAV
jgi:hypothetical protein